MAHTHFSKRWFSVPVVLICCNALGVDAAAAQRSAGTPPKRTAAESVQPSRSPIRIDVKAINDRLPKGRVVRIEPPLTESAFVLPPALSNTLDLARLPAGVPIVHIEVPSDEMIARGQAGSTAATSDTPEAVVFLQAADGGFFLPNQSSAGNFMAIQIFPGNGWTAGNFITGYDMLGWNSSANSGVLDVRTSLWDGDPLGVFDTACNGGSPAMIPGTEATFTGLPQADGICPAIPGNIGANTGCVGLHRLVASLPEKIQINCDSVWLVMEMDAGCRFGWQIPGPPTFGVGPAIGFSDGIALNAEGAIYADAEAGTCCAGGGPFNACAGGPTECDPVDDQREMPCDHTDADTSNDCFAHPTFCTDGIAEVATAFSYGAAAGSGYYASFVATLRAPAKSTMSLVPIGNDKDGGLDPGVTIDGNEITMPVGSRHVFLEVRVGDWDPDDIGVAVKAYRAEIDSSSYTLGPVATQPDPVPCLTDTDCFAAIGAGECNPASATCSVAPLPEGSLTPALIPCDGADDAAAQAVCQAALGPGAFCGLPHQCDSSVPGECFCAPYFIDFRDDFFLSSSALCARDLSTLDYSQGCALITGSVDDPEPFPEAGMYAGTLVLRTPTEVTGTFTVEIQFNGSAIADQNGLFIPLLGFSPARITIQPDCNGNGVPDVTDIENRSSKDCNGNGIPDDCETDTDCNGNRTLDQCDIADGTSNDCNANGLPDECEAGEDCNQNGVLDACDLADGVSQDCNTNGTPDECENDCNGNGLADECDLADGTSADCDGNGRPDECEPDCNGNLITDACDLTSGTSIDADGNGVPDECPCVVASPPLADGMIKSRYLSFRAGDLARVQAIRLTFDNLAPPFDLFNGMTMWVGAPTEVSENSGVVNPAPDLLFPTFAAATLQCEPFWADWSAVGTVQLSHENIVPGSDYTLQAVDGACGSVPQETNLSSASSALVTARWGDVGGFIEEGLRSPPDDQINIVTDVVAILNKFSNIPTAVIKARVDLAPATPDRLIQITDAVQTLDAFRGLGYPFKPGESPCGQ